MRYATRASILALVLAPFSPAAHASLSAGESFTQHFPEIPPPVIQRQAREASVNWSQPPLGCVEEMVPRAPDRPCLELRGVENPLKDWPSDLSPEEQEFWYGRRRELNVCRSRELLRREEANPGSQTPSSVAVAWMVTESVKNYETKVQAIYDAHRATGIPPHVLTGAIYQESLFAELGVADDGGNFSCGMQQINVVGWCEWANKQSASEKATMGWPAAGVNCLDKNLVATGHVQPYFQIAKSRLKGLPEYRLRKEHFANIPLESVAGSWPGTSPQIRATRHQVVRSFVENCSEPRRGILAKADQLALLYRRHVSTAFRNKDRYPVGERFARACRETPRGDAYPLHPGWLLAVAAYNAGPRAIEAVGHYQGWNAKEFNDPRVVRDFTPDQIIEAIYWAGRYNSQNDKMEFRGFNGRPLNWIWYKACVNQRHIARVIQHVTLLPEFFVDSLEGEYGCTKSVFKDGKLVKTSVPPHRRNSSGVK
jgi:hypothetical protein